MGFRIINTDINIEIHTFDTEAMFVDILYQLSLFISSKEYISTSFSLSTTNVTTKSLLHFYILNDHVLCFPLLYILKSI